MSEESTKAAFRKAFSDHALLNLSEEDMDQVNRAYKLGKYADHKLEKPDPSVQRPEAAH